MRCGWPIRVFHLNGHSRQFFSQQLTQTCFGNLCIVVLDDCLCNDGPALGRWRCLQDLPGLPLQWILQIGAENILLPTLAHSSAQPGIIAAARS